MDELVKTIDPGLKYLSHEYDGDTLLLHVASDREEAVCPVCGRPSSRVHSRYERTLDDLPVDGHKTKLVVHRRKLFCDNPACPRTTFAEPFDFFEHKAKRTNRLWDHILETAKDRSSTEASNLLQNGTCNVSFSSICGRKKKNSKAAEKDES